MKTHIAGLAIVGAFLGLICAQAAAVAPVMLTDLGSTVTVNPYSSAGMYAWNIGGVSQLQRQWFWLRVGDQGPETSIDTLGAPFVAASDTNYNGQNETLYLRYANTQLQAELTFALTGASAGVMQSDIAETIRLTNLTASPVQLHFFQLCDLDLGGTAEDLSVAILGGNTAQQQDMGYFASETVETPLATHRQAALSPLIYNSLTDSGPTTLSDSVGPIGPGDLSWAFQWDITLGAAGSPTATMLISKDKQIVPEPASLVLLALAGLMLRRKVR